MSGLVDNPFLVLGLPVTAGPREVEREAARLLGMLELGLAAAETYGTPMGPRRRTTEAVRAAAATLREPRKRLAAELWAAGGTEAPAESATGTGSDSGTGSGSVAGSDSGTDSDSDSGTGSGTGSGSVAGSGSEPGSSTVAGWANAFERTGWGRR
jgi:hypothetical protein